MQRRGARLGSTRRAVLRLGVVAAGGQGVATFDPRSGVEVPVLVALVVAFAWAGAGVAAAAPADVTFEGETMSLPPSDGDDVSDGQASGGQAQRIWTNGTATKAVTTTRSSVHLLVRARRRLPRRPRDLGEGGWQAVVRRSGQRGRAAHGAERVQVDRRAGVNPGRITHGLDFHD